jgi:hypothetical protein
MGMLIEGRWMATDKTIENSRCIRPKGRFSAELDANVIRRLRSQPGHYHRISISPAALEPLPADDA